MSGIGKTTLAKNVYNERCNGRGYCCGFIAGVRESSKHGKGTMDLQRKLLRDLGVTFGDIMGVDDGTGRMRETLPHEKVLTVLDDDVDDKKQIQNPARDASWFGQGQQDYYHYSKSRGPRKRSSTFGSGSNGD